MHRVSFSEDELGSGDGYITKYIKNLLNAVTRAYNPDYSGGRDLEDCGLRQA
jgi:hypothetical protein